MMIVVWEFQKKMFVVYFQFKRLNNFIDKVWRNQLIEGCFIATSSSSQRV